MTKNHYINNKEFYAAIAEYHSRCLTLVAEGKQKPRIPEFIGKCILQIATNLGRKRQYSGYAYLDEMIADACSQCVRYLHIFDPARSTNPFSFFTQCCYHSFIHRIGVEKKQLYIKIKSVVESPVLGETANTEEGDHSLDNIEAAFENMHQFVGEYEDKHNLRKQRKKRVKKTDSSLYETSDSETA